MNTWVHYFEAESKRHGMEWEHTSSNVRKKFRTQSSAGKMLLTVFCDAHVVLFCGYLEFQRTNILCLLLGHADEQREKRRGSQKRLHDDLPTHHAADPTTETIEKTCWELPPHPPYSPDLAPWVIHLFSPLKEALRRKKFSNNEKVNNFGMVAPTTKQRLFCIRYTETS